MIQCYQTKSWAHYRSILTKLSSSVNRDICLNVLDDKPRKYKYKSKYTYSEGVMSRTTIKEIGHHQDMDLSINRAVAPVLCSNIPLATKDSVSSTLTSYTGLYSIYSIFLIFLNETFLKVLSIECSNYLV